MSVFFWRMNENTYIVVSDFESKKLSNFLGHEPVQCVADVADQIRIQFFRILETSYTADDQTDNYNRQTTDGRVPHVGQFVQSERTVPVVRTSLKNLVIITSCNSLTVEVGRWKVGVGVLRSCSLQWSKVLEQV